MSIFAEYRNWSKKKKMERKHSPVTSHRCTHPRLAALDGTARCGQLNETPNYHLRKWFWKQNTSLGQSGGKTENVIPDKCCESCSWSQRWVSGGVQCSLNKRPVLTCPNYTPRRIRGGIERALWASHNYTQVFKQEGPVTRERTWEQAGTWNTHTHRLDSSHVAWIRPFLF